MGRRLLHEVFAGKVGGVVCCALALLINVLGAQAQSVRNEGIPFGYGASVKKFQREAEKQKWAYWPVPAEGSGTQARITFDAHNADVTLAVPISFGEQRLLAEARRIAQKLGLPNTDFIIIQGSKTVSVDLELNKYLTHRGRRTEYSFNLSTLAAALWTSDLPGPIGMAADMESATNVTLQTPLPGSSNTVFCRNVTGYWFGRPSDIQPVTWLHMVAEPVWYAYPALAVFLGLFLLPILMPWHMEHIKRKRAQEQRRIALETAAEPPTPEEVQAKYDGTKSQWKALLLPALLPFVFLLVDFKRLMLSVFMIVPEGIQYLAPAAVGMMGLSFAGAALLTRFLARRDPVLPLEEPPTPENVALRVMRVPLLMMGGIMLLMMLMTTWMIAVPAPTPQAWQTRRYVLFVVLGVAGLTFAAIPFVIRRVQRGLRERLEGGTWYDLTQSLAAQTGVPVRRLDLLKSSTVNAFASLNGTVTLTTGLTEKMQPDEARVIIAHELAHIKRGHVRKTFVLSLATFAVVWGGWFGLRLWLQSHISENARLALGSPVLFIIGFNLLLMLLLGPGRRRREEEADRLALAWIGDADLVIHTLTKMHTLNATPHRLRPEDQAFSTHPSLVRRVDLIRARVAAEKELGDHAESYGGDIRAGKE